MLEEKLAYNDTRFNLLERRIDDNEQYSRRTCLRINGIPYSGTLVLWYSGTLVLWYSGTLVLWYSGTLVLWYSGTLVLWYSGTLVLWYSGTLVLWYSGTLVLWYSGTLVLWYSGTLVLWYSGTLVLWYSGTLVLWYSGTLVLWYSGTLVLWYSGNETAEESLQKVKDEVAKLGVDCDARDFDRAHRVGKQTEDGQGRQMIVKFSTFRARTMAYRNRKKANVGNRDGGGVRFYIDQTKRRFQLKKKAGEYVKTKPQVDFVFVDINCIAYVLKVDNSNISTLKRN